MQLLDRYVVIACFVFSFLCKNESLKTLFFTLYTDLLGTFLSIMNRTCYLDEIYITIFFYLSFLPNKEK